jgi:hypothetical protein
VGEEEEEEEESAFLEEERRSVERKGNGSRAREPER